MKQLLTAGRSAAGQFPAPEEHWCVLAELPLLPAFSIEQLTLRGNNLDRMRKAQLANTALSVITLHTLQQHSLILHVDTMVSYIIHLTHLNSENVNKRANILLKIIILSDLSFLMTKEQHTLAPGNQQQVLFPSTDVSILFCLD